MVLFILKGRVKQLETETVHYQQHHHRVEFLILDSKQFTLLS